NHAAISRLRIYLGCSTRSFEAGSTITGDFIALPRICRYSDWTKRWRVGRHRNSRDFAVVNGVHINGSPGYPGVPPRCSLTGRSCGSVLLWEPYERRRSRPVLGEREGAIPSRYSPGNLTTRFFCQSEYALSGSLNQRSRRQEPSSSSFLSALDIFSGR